MENKATLKVYDTPDQMSIAVADLIISLSQEAITKRGRFSIALSGGSTPDRLFTLLSTNEYKDCVDWQRTFVFWGDERCVPLSDEKNNANQAKKLLLDKVDIPAANIYRIPTDFEPQRAAILYEDSIRFFFKGTPHFDLILLGLGDNGHTASLFPDTDVLKEQTHWVKEVYVEEQKMYRITMTALLINQANNIAFLVAGKEKTQILQAILGKDAMPDKYPAQLIKPAQGHLYWYADKAAAGDLKQN
jgi:6-phosphogluconolactonase